MISFPTIVKDRAWHLSDAELARLQEEFPTLDVPAQMEAARAWLTDNWMRRRAPKYMPRFVEGWLERAARADTPDAELLRQIAALRAEAERRGLDAA